MHRCVTIALGVAVVLVTSACTSTPGASPAGTPIPASAEAPTEEPTEEPTQAPQVAIRFAYSSEADIHHLPSLMAGERISALGYEFEPIFFAQTELATEAVARGDAQFNEQGVAVLVAIQQGADIKVVAEQAANPWLVVGTADMETCEDLHGRTFGIHSEGSGSSLQVFNYIEKTCPDAEPQYLIVPGSENRAAAILAGQMDATVVDRAQLPQLLADAEGVVDLHVIADLAEATPELKGFYYAVNTSFAAEHPEAVVDYLKAVIEVHREILEDTELLMEAGRTYLDIDEELLAMQVDAYVESRAFNPNGDLTEADIEAAIEFLVEGGQLEPGLSADDVADLTFMETVMAELGTQ